LIDSLNYWKNFYKKNEVPTSESDFARFTVGYIKKNCLTGRLIDVGCGNGRDSRFFAASGISTSAIDASIQLSDPSFEFECQDIISHDYTDFQFIYMRFLIHAITEKKLDALLEKLSKNNSSLMFIETRSTRGITSEQKLETNFRSPIGTEHYRILYSQAYLDHKFHRLNTIFKSEGQFAPYRTENPFVLRYILKS